MQPEHDDALVLLARMDERTERLDGEIQATRRDLSELRSSAVTKDSIATTRWILCTAGGALIVAGVAAIVALVLKAGA